MFDWNIVIGAIGDFIIVPIIGAIGVGLVLIVKHRIDKISKSVIAKNEISEMEKENTIRRDLINTIGTLVESAVASNMQLANKMKETGMKLTEEQISELNRSTKQLVINSLPPSVTNDDGVLLEIIGGKEKLDAIIVSMMEKYVYEYKLKAKAGEVNMVAQPRQNPVPFYKR